MRNSTLADPARRPMPGMRLLAGALALVVAAGMAASARADEALADLVEKVSPAVVTVLAETERERTGRAPQSPFEEFFRRFGEGRGLPNPFDRGPRQGLGSGFVIEGGGFIVTNHHVVSGADRVTVRMTDRREFEAAVVGTDEQTDLALLKVDSDADLPFVSFGDSDAVRVGEDVFAVGNPFGLGGTVTRGIVSATQRDIRAGPYVDFIQTDAAINRGNSGGPLFAMDGRVIGVNSAIYSPNGGSVGVGFAVASNIVKEVIAELREDGEVSRGWLGVTIQDVTPDIADAIGLDTPRGALVATVLDDGPSAGTLKQGDVILSYGGDAVESSRVLPKLVGATEAGESVEIEVLRDGSRQTLTLEVGAFEDRRRAALDGRGGRGPGVDGGEASASLGATLEPLTPDARANLGLERSVDGVVVTSLRSGGPAARAGLEVGDVIVGVGNERVASLTELDRALGETGRDSALLLVRRGDAEIFIGMQLG